MSKIKICGLKRLEDIVTVNAYKPDFIGFVFANTKRFITDEQAAELKKHLDNNIKAVGVFVNEPIEHIVKLVFEKSIDIVQLHGQEDLNYVNQLREAFEEKIGSQKKDSKFRVPIIKVVRIEADEIAENLFEINKKRIEDAKACDPEYLLFDSKVKGILGGSGQTFDIAGLPDNDFIGLPYFLAGGINLQNMSDLVKLRCPFGIDVSSAVETDGYKDASKIKEMIEAVRNCG